MNGHDPQRHPALPFLPGHPVRNAAHVDRGQNGVSNRAVLEQGFGRAHRLVVAHILVYCQNDISCFASFNCLQSFRIIRTQRFLSENPLYRATRTGGLYDFQLIVRWNRKVQHLNRFIVEELINCIVDNIDAVPLSAMDSVFFCATGNGGWVEPGFVVGDQMAVVHNESAANAANTPVFAFGQG